MKKLLYTLLALTICPSLNAQLIVDNTRTVQDLVQNVLLGPGVTASGITFNGLPASTVNIQLGYFDGTNSNLGLNEGIMLGSGDVTMAIGPNNNGGNTLPAGGTGSGPDNDLATIIGAPGSFDKSVIEFDFIPAGDSLTFNYVFASEEYLEFVNAGFNDAFGFFLSGPGISGPYSNNAINIALIPATTTPVTIDNVNNSVNAAYYVDNGNGNSTPQNTDPTVLQYDGFTVVMQAQAVVQCGQTYHIKLAISDAGDSALDSGVFLEAGSFSSAGEVQISAVSGDGTNLMVEGESCGNAVFTFTRPTTDGDLTINFNITGDAVNGIDYGSQNGSAVPDSVTIPDGQSSVSLPVIAFSDTNSEQTETIVFEIIYVNSCGDSTIESDTIFLINIDDIIGRLSPDATICVWDGVYEHLPTYLNNPSDTTIVSVDVDGGTGHGTYTYTWSDGTAPQIDGDSTSSIIVSPGMDTDYYVTITDTCSNQITVGPIRVEVKCPIVIPNVFSPNGDGNNEFFTILNIEQYPNNKVVIYNRWGNKIYERENYQNDWDGEEHSDGVYYYIVTTGEEGENPFTGHVNIVGKK